MSGTCLKENISGQSVGDSLEQMEMAESEINIFWNKKSFSEKVGSVLQILKGLNYLIPLEADNRTGFI